MYRQSRNMHVFVGIGSNLSVSSGSRNMHVYAGINSNLSVSSVSVCIGPLGHGNHHSIPKTPSRDPAPGGTHSGHPRACAQPLFDPIPIPPLDPIFRFFQHFCAVVHLAMAVESARIVQGGSNLAQSSSHAHCVCISAC